MPSSTSWLITVFVGSLAAGLLGHLPTRWLMDYLWRKFYTIPDAEKPVGGRDTYKDVQIFIKLLGILERAVYAGGWLLGKAEVIAVILALKATPSLKEWSENKALGRALFNIWLIGNLVNIIESILFAEVVRLLIKTYLP